MKWEHIDSVWIRTKKQKQKINRTFAWTEYEFKCLPQKEERMQLSVGKERRYLPRRGSRTYQKAEFVQEASSPSPGPTGDPCSPREDPRRNEAWKEWPWGWSWTCSTWRPASSSTRISSCTLPPGNKRNDIVSIKSRFTMILFLSSSGVPLVGKDVINQGSWCLLAHHHGDVDGHDCIVLGADGRIRVEVLQGFQPPCQRVVLVVELVDDLRPILAVNEMMDSSWSANKVPTSSSSKPLRVWSQRHKTRNDYYHFLLLMDYY